MVAVEIDLAAWDEKAAVDEVDQAMGEIAGEVWAEVGSAVFLQTARDEDLGIAVVHRELDVGVGLVVAQQDVEARLALLDQVVFKRQRFAFVIDRDVVDVDRLAHQRAGLAIVDLVSLEEIRAHARAQVLGLADVDDLAFGILVEIAAGRGGERADFFEEIHAG